MDSLELSRRLAQLALTEPIVHAELHRLMRDEERSLEDAMLAMIEALVGDLRRNRAACAGALAQQPLVELIRTGRVSPEPSSGSSFQEPSPPSSGSKTPPPSSGSVCIICGAALEYGRYCSDACYRADEGYGDREEPDHDDDA